MKNLRIIILSMTISQFCFIGAAFTSVDEYDGDYDYPTFGEIMPTAASTSLDTIYRDSVISFEDAMHITTDFQLDAATYDVSDSHKVSSEIDDIFEHSSVQV